MHTFVGVRLNFRDKQHLALISIVISLKMVLHILLLLKKQLCVLFSAFVCNANSPGDTKETILKSMCTFY